MKFEQFVGIFPNAISDKVCLKFVKWFDTVSEQGITMSSMERTKISINDRKDEVIVIPNDLPLNCFPSGMVNSLWESISDCFQIYYKEYDMRQNVTSYSFKMHRVQPTGGYHVWHHEHDFVAPYRVLAWMVVLEAPEAGGETEFMFQSMRVESKVGQLLIWPAGFTHKHRGNPPLEGHKTYITGWFEMRPTLEHQK